MERKSIIELYKEFPKRTLIDSGSEAIVTNINGYAYKEFWTNDIEKLKRKEKKLLDLEQMRHLQPYFPKVISLIEAKSKEYIKGYVMELIKKIKTSLNIQERLRFLQQLKEILNLFSKEGYLYLDIRRPNVVIGPNKTPILLDIDSIISLDRLESDCLPYDIKVYIQNGGKISTNAQILMFNKLARSILDLEPNYYGDNDEISFDDPLFNKPTPPLTETDELVLDKTGTRILYELENYASLPDAADDHEYIHEHVLIK